ncbi:MAG: hypothetical protein LBJ72_03760 [Dysgonamonadaceae bacterium]|jgi:hypothetical protein|nr:hypothetical protein [Dysgonamonadaceae bacterium]
MATAKISLSKYRGEVGSLENLNTSTKSTLVGAINEVKTNAAPSSHVGATGTSQHGIANGTAAGFSDNNFTSAEKTKLAGLDGNHFKGNYTSPTALETAFPTAVAGDYANVDEGAGNDVTLYIYDVDDAAWVAQKGVSTAETAAGIKTKYESNADTNAYTDAEKDKLSGIAAGATKVEESDVNGCIKINNTDVVVYSEIAISEDDYLELDQADKDAHDYVII